MSSATAELIKLRNLERILVKAEVTCLERLDQHEGTDLSVLLHDLEAKRREELCVLRSKMIAIHKPLYKMKDIIENNDVDQIDLRDLKEEMLQTKQNIELLKQEAKQRLEELQNEELNLKEDVTAYEDKFAEWEKPILNTNFPVQKRISTSANNLCQEAKDFLYFVAKSGGHENGWPVDDHTLFLKVRKSSKSTKQLAHNLHKMLPDISEEEILAHDNWYKKYLELKEKQKVAIATWRSAKSTSLHNNNSRKCVSAPSSKVKTRFPVSKATKQELAVWKKNKEENLKRELEAKRLETSKRKELEEQKRKRNEELKREISQWRSLKVFKTETEKMALEFAQKQEKALKAIQANKLIKQFQSQDNVYVERKKLLHLKERTKSEERVKPAVVARRDPDRILKPTKNWLLKLKSESENREGPICNIKNIERLRFPEWRKGIF